jgi:hypothetical protein
VSCRMNISRLLGRTLWTHIKSAKKNIHGTEGNTWRQKGKETFVLI